MSILKELEANLPKNAEISEAKFEASEIVLYTKNKDFFRRSEELIRDTVTNLKKRIEIRPDPSISLDVESAKRSIEKIVHPDAGIKAIYFEPELGKVVIEASKPGLVIGKGGETYKNIKNTTLWLPKIERAPAINSEIVRAVRNLLHSEIGYRKTFLNKIGQSINSPPKVPKENEWIRLAFLGGARQVGRSCIFVETPNSNILLDCGVDVGSDSIPYIDAPEFSIDKIDAVVLSHAHLDHCAYIPWLYENGYKGPLYCTPPTRDLMVLLCLDYIDVCQREGKNISYSKKSVENAVKHSIVLEYGEVSDITTDARLTLEQAGHLLGSSLVHLHVGDGLHNILYSGDLKFGPSRLFEPAVTNFQRVETLILESTYGGAQDLMPSRRDSEKQLLDIIENTMKRGGKVLIPAFAVGRAQEIMVILAANKLDYPVWLEGMLWDSTAVHTAYPEYLSHYLQRDIFHYGKNPFLSDIFHRVVPKERDGIIDSAEPGVIIATSGMLSVDSKEPVLIRNSGKNKLINIGDFVDENIKEKDRIKICGATEGEMVYLNNNIKAAALNLKTGKIEFAPITAILRHKIDKPIFEITTKSGRKVKVTGSHSVLALENGKIIPKKVSELKTNDLLVIPRLIDSKASKSKSKSHEINIGKEFLKLDKKLTKSVYVRGNVLKYAKNDWQRKNKTVPLSSLKNIPKNCKIGFGCATMRTLPSIIRFTPDLFRLLGYYAAEGCIHISTKSRVGYISLSFGIHEKELIRDATRCFEVFGRKTKTSIHKDKSFVKVLLNDKLVAYLFKYIFKTGSHSGKKRVPSIVFEAPKKLQLEFLKGYILGDGYIGKRGGRIILELCSKSPRLISDLSYILGMIGSPVNAIHKRIKKSRQIREKILKSSKQYRLTTGNASYLKSLQDILPSNVNKMLNKVKEKEQAPFALPIKESNFKSLMKKVKIKKLKDIKWSISTRKRITFSRAKKIVKLLEKEGINTTGIKNLISGYIGFDPVKKMKKVKASSKYVYDLSLVGYENFCGGFGGLILHNTGGPAIEYLKALAPEKKNTLIFVGYQAEGTLGRRIQKGWKEIPIIKSGKTQSLPIEMQVETVGGLSGHSDHNQLINYMYRLPTKLERVILNHGDNYKCSELAREIHKLVRCETLAPKNLEVVRLK